MTIRVVCNGCGEPAEHTVSINVMAYPKYQPTPYNPYADDDEQGPYIPFDQFAFDFCGKEKCFEGLASEQKLKIDTFIKEVNNG